jgi:type II secretory pathway component HofQ
MKEKYYAKDMHSQIAQGRPLSRKEFIKQKENLIKNNKLNLTNKTFKKILIDKKEERKGMNKSCSVNTGLEYKDPNDYSKQLLKNNYLYFDKNNTQIIRNRKCEFNGKR